MTVPTYHSDTRFVEEDDKTDLPGMAWHGMAWHGRSASFLSFFKPAITPPSTTPQQLISPSW